MRSRIVRLAIFAAVSAITLFGIPLAVGVAIYVVADERGELERFADAAAVSVSGDLVRGQHPPSLTRPEAGTRIAVYDQSGARIAGDGPARADAAVGQALAGRVSSSHLHGRLAVAVPVSDGDSVTGAVMASATNSQSYGRIATAWLAMLGLGAAAIGATWLLARHQARKLARPLDALSATARQLGDGDFSVRTQPVGIAEIDSVKTSLNLTAARLGALLDRERAFSADASHQLRTPLTGLRLGLEAALDDPGVDAHSAIRDAIGATDRLERIVSDLLTLGRDRPQRSEPLDIAALIEDIRERWTGPLAAHERPLRLIVAQSLGRTFLSRGAATHILDVLLDNADRHGRGAITLTIRQAASATAIDVADEGPPLAADATELFRRSADATGHGIGLAFARSLAESEGARLRLTTPDPPTFTLLAPGHVGPDPDPNGAQDQTTAPNAAR